MGYPKYSHDPDAVLDYPFHWTPWLEDVNDTLVSVDVTAEDKGDSDTAPLVVDSFSFDPGGEVAVWLSGGSVGLTYAVTCHIVTTDNREEDKTILIQVKEH